MIVHLSRSGVKKNYGYNNVHLRIDPRSVIPAAHLRARNGTNHAIQNKDEKKKEKNSNLHATSEALFPGTQI